jgi:hypothetical protein
VRGAVFSAAMLTAAARSGVMPAQREEPMDRYRIVALTLATSARRRRPFGTLLEPEPL